MAIEAVAEAHRELSLANAVDVPRQRTRLPQTALHILQGALPGRDAIGYKAYTSNRSGVRFLVHVFSAASGVLRVVVTSSFTASGPTTTFTVAVSQTFSAALLGSGMHS